ncbi:hypothetical protein LTS18_010853 [Coniosporium uncinatum]|uniref:Uncharacterized protein n=1 Tax=Coniosporium uncinatum TaxID=93489 RepID=A0ACC3DWC8_9PEZI|nr:hypothetical protein LTS18_010853 [Coniosporium uncinatum]
MSCSIGPHHLRLAPSPARRPLARPEAHRWLREPLQAPRHPAFAASDAPDGSPYNAGLSILSIVYEWRATVPVPSLKWSTQLEANALKTGTDNGGVNHNQELNPGSYAQVITPGMLQAGSFNLKGDTPFDLNYVAWLCEKPVAALTNGTVDQCALVKDVLNIQYSGTGHADILNTSGYKTIGCAFVQNRKAAASSPYQGPWTCHLGY